MVLFKTVFFNLIVRFFCKEEKFFLFGRISENLMKKEFYWKNTFILLKSIFTKLKGGKYADGSRPSCWYMYTRWVLFLSLRFDGFAESAAGTNHQKQEWRVQLGWVFFNSGGVTVLYNLLLSRLFGLLKLNSIRKHAQNAINFCTICYLFYLQTSEKVAQQVVLLVCQQSTFLCTSTNIPFFYKQLCSVGNFK